MDLHKQNVYSQPFKELPAMLIDHGAVGGQVLLITGVFLYNVNRTRCQKLLQQEIYRSLFLASNTVRSSI